jgi:hypothetical protein
LIRFSRANTRKTRKLRLLATPRSRWRASLLIKRGNLPGHDVESPPKNT